MKKQFSIINFQLSINLGFTLVELLLAFGIIAVIGTIVLSILFLTLRVSKKSDVLIGLKQSGNTAMSQIVKQIRYAKSLDSPTSCITPKIGDITITSSLDNAQTTFSCSVPSATISSNSASLVDTSSVAVTNCSFTCTQTTLNDPPTIGIKFTLSNAGSGPFETTGSVPFQTSVTMRNFSR